MIVVNLTGGLGNQMFQFAFGYSAAKSSETSLHLDIRSYNSHVERIFQLKSVFDIDSPLYDGAIPYPRAWWKRLLRPDLHNLAYIKEPHFHFSEDLKIQDQVYLDGYWQSYKYFASVEDDIRQIFKFKNSLSPSRERLRQKICNSSSVSLHIRRGDYIQNHITNSVHGVCGLEYYEKCIEIIKGRLKQPVFYVFSDDPDWCSEVFKGLANCEIISRDPVASDWEELCLMSLCSHNIIANSSFSWWGGWLNASPDKIVIAPNQWFLSAEYNTKDLIPKTWVLI